MESTEIFSADSIEVRWTSRGLCPRQFPENLAPYRHAALPGLSLQSIFEEFVVVVRIGAFVAAR